MLNFHLPETELLMLLLQLQSPASKLSTWSPIPLLVGAILALFFHTTSSLSMNQAPPNVPAAIILVHITTCLPTSALETLQVTKLQSSNGALHSSPDTRWLSAPPTHQALSLSGLLHLQLSLPVKSHP